MKDIILFTMPHSGTHTVHYIFNTLLGVQVWWGHFEKRLEPKLDELLKLAPDPDRFVHVQTYRDTESLRDSHLRRNADGEDFFKECVETRANYRPRLNEHFGQPIILRIEDSEVWRTHVVHKICRAVGVEPSLAVAKFLREWPKVNSYQGGVENDDDRKRAASKSIHRSNLRHLIREIEENHHGT